MKKSAFTFLLLLTSNLLFAQLELGASLGPGSSWLLNNNASDQGDNLNYQTSYNFGGGIHAAYFFNESLGLAVELNYTSFNQKYEGDLGGEHYESADHLRYMTIPIMLALKTPGGFYFEVGPQFNIFSSAKGEFTAENIPDSLNWTDRDIETGFSKSVIGGVFGFGGRFDLTDNLSLTTGLRFFIGFADATEELTETELLDAFLDESVGTTVFYAHTDQDGNFRYENTMAVSGSLLLGVVYIFGGKE